MYTLNRTCAGRSPSFKFNAHILLLCPKNLWHHILSLCLCFFNQIFSWACHHGNKLPIQTTIPHRHQQNQTRIQHGNSFLVFLQLMMTVAATWIHSTVLLQQQTVFWESICLGRDSTSHSSPWVSHSPSSNPCFGHQQTFCNMAPLGSLF